MDGFKGLKNEKYANKCMTILEKNGQIQDIAFFLSSIPSTYRVCNSCNRMGVLGDTILDCSGCHTNFYCNDECRKADYESHRAVCNRGSRWYHFCTQCDPEGLDWRPNIRFCKHEGCTLTICKKCVCPKHHADTTTMGTTCCTACKRRLGFLDLFVSHKQVVSATRNL